jgi:hypothetical protein
MTVAGQAMTDEQTAELIALVNAHGTPAAVRAMAALLNENAELRRVTPPKTGRTVLTCRCGRALDLADMRWLPSSTGDHTVVRPIVCDDCARPGRG